MIYTTSPQPRKKKRFSLFSKKKVLSKKTFSTFYLLTLEKRMRRDFLIQNELSPFQIKRLAGNNGNQKREKFPSLPIIHADTAQSLKGHPQKRERPT